MYEAGHTRRAERLSRACNGIDRRRDVSMGGGVEDVGGHV